MKKILMITVVSAVIAMQTVWVFAQKTAGMDITVSGKTAVGDVADISVSLSGYENEDVMEIGTIQVNIGIDTKYLEFVEGSDKIQLKTRSKYMLTTGYNAVKNEMVFIYMANGKALARDAKAVFSFKVKIKSALPKGGLSLPVKTVGGDTSSPMNRFEFALEQPKIMPPSSSGGETSGNQESTSSAQSTSAVTTAAPTPTATTVGGKAPVEIDTSEDDDNPWDNVKVDSPDKSVTVEKTPGGVIVRGNDLSGTKVIVEKDGRSYEIEIDSDSKEVVIKEDDGVPAVFEDKDGSGNFNNKIASAVQKPRSPQIVVIVAVITAAAVLLVAVAVVVLPKMKKRTDTKHD